MTSFDRIVLIDDNEDDNFFHEIVIRKAGFQGELRVFENGVDALTFLKADPLVLRTCVFVDINMPMLDGFEVVAQAAPLLEDKTSTTVVMLTSSDAPTDRARARDMPLIKAFFTKPLKADLFQRLVNASQGTAPS